MNINNVRAVFFGIAVTLAAAPGAFASADMTQVTTDPCAKVMNWPARAIVYNATPQSERGLQCPIQEDFGAPLE
jgi:hypothetical protein